MPIFQYGGACKLCGSDGTNKTTCPLNPDAINVSILKHPKAMTMMMRSTPIKAVLRTKHQHKQSQQEVQRKQPQEQEQEQRKQSQEAQRKQSHEVQRKQSQEVQRKQSQEQQSKQSREVSKQEHEKELYAPARQRAKWVKGQDIHIPYFKDPIRVHQRAKWGKPVFHKSIQFPEHRAKWGTPVFHKSIQVPEHKEADLS